MHLILERFTIGYPLKLYSVAMKDSEFKSSTHTCTGFTVFSTGREIEKNYSPDIVLVCANDFIIIEHETEPNRKTIVADIFKAAFFLQGKREGLLIIVMTPKGSSSFESYPRHVEKYVRWLIEKTNLKKVLFIHPDCYFNNGSILEINTEDFLQGATIIQ